VCHWLCQCFPTKQHWNSHWHTGVGMKNLSSSVHEAMDFHMNWVLMFTRS